MTAPVMVRVGSSTHTGTRRALNEDAQLSTAPVFIVADGMGGHEAGEVASGAVVAEFSQLVGRDALELDDVRRAVARARASVDQLATTGARAGTTLSGVVISSVDGLGYWLAVNIGDSRTYRFASGELEQISEDHSVIQELLDAGELTPEQALTDSRRNIITRAIGAGSTGDADFWLFPAERGDRMLVCSDGLTSEVSEARITEVLSSEADPQRAADLLTADAVNAGGRDNITVVVVDAVAVTTRPGTIVLSDEMDDVDADTRPRETLTGGVR
ncbi:PP2C family protein-serine/threonine phosphatase [Microbacterium esteraromaticum]|uniref:PP2C family protein-serine/threonine phosphatase n=1 Tax=Microbacterium esteraromaticum TaxID=57043 RepID=UPI00195B5CC7|nr:protein phosphatase 2C domain-containing protein [Microbacterium esteraromaticum]MBM7466462.1 protein phosphatase [Microbacterium esteraromaticum]